MLFIPVPRADQVEPFHLAIRLVLATPPAFVKNPPAYKLLLESTAKVFTVLFTPLPIADQVEPFHLAMKIASAPPAIIKVPPAYNLLLESTAKAFTVLFSPNPKFEK